jgi:hypothetical protein
MKMITKAYLIAIDDDVGLRAYTLAATDIDKEAARAQPGIS